MQKEYAMQFYKTINKLLCNLSFAGQYINEYPYGMRDSDLKHKKKLSTLIRTHAPTKTID